MEESSLEMNYEFNLLGKATNLKLKGGKEFQRIKDEPVEKEQIEKKKNFFSELVENINPIGILATAVCGVLAIGAAIISVPLEGIAAIVCGAIAIGAIIAETATALYTVSIAVIDTVTNHKTSDKTFLRGVLTSGALGFTIGLTFPFIGGAGTLGATIEGIGAVGVITVSSSGVIENAVGLLGALLLVSEMNGEYDEDWSYKKENKRRPKKGKEFRGGKKKDRDKWFGITDKNFKKWWERVGKKEWGIDLEDSKMAQEIYQYWKDIGMPNANGGNWD